MTTSKARGNVVKLNSLIYATDPLYGAKGDGVTDDTAALLAAFNFCIANGKTLVLDGSFLVSGPLCTIGDVSAGDLHIHCIGDVVITVNSASTAFDALIWCASTAINNSSITGGSLSIDGNNKCGSGILVRHNSATSGGVVNFSALVKVSNLKQNDAAETAENYGIAIIGAYDSITLNQPEVDTVDRSNTTGGACSGISVSGFTGKLLMLQPKAARVLCTGSASDADGIKVFGKNSGDGYKSQGSAVLVGPIFEDNQGRQFKSQCSDTKLICPKSIRQMVVSITSGVDYDFQWGNGLLIEPIYEYKLNGATTPLGTSFVPVIFQQVLTDAEMVAKSIGGVLKTEVTIRNYAFIVHYNALLPALAEYSSTIVDGLSVVSIGTLTGDVFTRAIVETDMGRVEDKSLGTKIVVNDVSGPIGNAYGIGYTGYTAGALSSKLDIEITNLNNTRAIAAANYLFRALSGSNAVDPQSFLFFNNHGYRDLMVPSWTFNFNALRPGNAFTVDTATVVATNPPPWASSQYALIECLGDYFAATDKNVRVTVGTAARSDYIFYTRDGGTTWTVPDTLPSLAAASIADKTNAINTTNKRVGKMVHDSTNNRIMIAAGTTDVSAWWVADGSASVVPA